MSQLRTFAPWIAYPAASALFGWQAGCAVALGICVVGVLLDGRPATTDPFRVAALVFFGAMTAIAFADPTSMLHRFVPALIPAALAAAAAASIALAQPFTIAFAKRVAPARVLGDAAVHAHQRCAHHRLGDQLRRHRSGPCDGPHGCAP